MALYGALFLIPLYFQQERGMTALAAGTILARQGAGSPLSRWVGRGGALSAVNIAITVGAFTGLPAC